MWSLFFFSSRRRHTRLQGDWSSDVCSSDLVRRARSHRRDEPRRGRHADPRLRSGPRSCRDGILRGAVPRGQGARGGGVSGVEAAQRGRRRRRDRVHRQPARAREHSRPRHHADRTAQRVRRGQRTMKASVVVALGAALVVLAACDNGNGPPPPQASRLRVLHTIRGGPSLTVFVDGGRGSTVAFGQLSRTVFLSPGQHDLVLVPPDTTHSLIVLFSAAEGVNYSAFAIDSTSGATHTIEPVFVLDTDAVPPAGDGRLKIARFPG